MIAMHVVAPRIGSDNMVRCLLAMAPRSVYCGKSKSEVGVRCSSNRTVQRSIQLSG